MKSKNDNKFILTTNMKPIADQINAIKELVDNIKHNVKSQVLLGATGTGKTFTIANVIERLQAKTLIIVHNKTLAAQLYGEFKELFKNNNVEYFISYFDFYQPEAYKPTIDLYIEKNAQRNSDIEMMRLSTINSLATSSKVIVVASVAAIYASISPNDYDEFKFLIKKNEKINYKQFQYQLVKLQYERNQIDLKPRTFRINGDVIEIAPGTSDEYIIRISLFGDVIESIHLVDSLTGSVLKKEDYFIIPPANEYIMNESRFKEGIKRITQELDERISYFKSNGKLLEAQRIQQRTKADVEALKELGFCPGIENYSRHLELREEGETPYTIFDYYGNKDWLLVIDESHMTIPQIRGMYNTDRNRKQTLVDYGFRLPSALDNRPLNFKEFNSKIKHIIYCSATPNEYEINESNGIVVQQIVRPTGLVDPIIEIHPTKDQIDNLITEIKKQISNNERTFVTVLTIKMAETLTEYLKDKHIKVAYLHHGLKPLQRSKILNDMRRGKYDVIVGVNLLREGLDAPEVSLVCIFDADKPGIFRNSRALIQTFGRAARNINGRVIMYANNISKDMKIAIDETNRRRKIQIEYNKKHHIKPKTIIKEIRNDFISDEQMKLMEAAYSAKKKGKEKQTKAIKRLRKEMLIAAKNKEYEKAAYLRDLIIELNGNLEEEK
ncbi:MAG: excinuclease ABC subunit UvrB [Mycoplasma sp.]|nr:excinuclease ABC subunit UvrB [Mycoplasma sp.]